MNGRINTIKPHTAINILSRFASVIYEFNKRSEYSMEMICQIGNKNYKMP